MIRRAIVVLALLAGGCTMQMDNPFAKKESEEMKLVRKRIAAFELLEREAELLLSISRHKAATAALNTPPKTK